MKKSIFLFVLFFLGGILFATPLNAEGKYYICKFGEKKCHAEGAEVLISGCVYNVDTTGKLIRSEGQCGPAERGTCQSYDNKEACEKELAGTLPYFVCDGKCLQEGTIFYKGGGTLELKAGPSACGVVYRTLEECKKKVETPNQEQPTSGNEVTGVDTSGLTTPDASSLNKLGTTDINTIIGRVIKSAMGIIGAIALVMVVYGGALWMTSAGNAERAKKGRDVIVWSSLGIVLIFASYAIVDLVFEAFR